mmetsp:Transcript_7802/g.11523  ORF Transcript_7802/g.11523 Transcript_7802/m.11523 type:complete len:329 (-) Transcript_7802:313-1299(-)
MQIRLVLLAILALPEMYEAFTATRSTNTAYRARHAQTSFFRTLSAATTTTTNGSEASSNSKLYDNNNEDDDDDDDDDDGIPVAWSQFQDWALMDNLPKYMIDTNYFSSKKSKKNSRIANNNKNRQPAARWRSMVREVPELTGFDVELVRRRYSKLLLLEKNNTDHENQDASNPKITKTPPTSFLPDILPLLEKYSFEKEGGLSGYAYGIAGVADGTQMTTPPLRGCEVTIPQGWVESEDGSCIYELGDPLDVEQTAGYSLDYAKQAAADVSKGLVSAASSNGGLSSPSSSNEDTQALVNLAALTGMLLVSAAAVNSLSHHVSVHVYWV